MISVPSNFFVDYITIFTVFVFRFASTFWMLLKRINMVGFGNVLKAKDVYIAMHCHLDSN